MLMNLRWVLSDYPFRLYASMKGYTYCLCIILIVLQLCKLWKTKNDVSDMSTEMQMNFFSSGIQWEILSCKATLTLTHFASIFLDSLYHSSLSTYVWVVWIFLWTSWNILLVPSFSYHVNEYLWHMFHFHESWDPRKASETCHMRKCVPLISKQGTKRNFASITFLFSE